MPVPALILLGEVALAVTWPLNLCFPLCEVGLGAPAHWVAVRVSELSFERPRRGTPKGRSFPQEHAMAMPKGRVSGRQWGPQVDPHPAVRPGAGLLVSPGRARPSRQSAGAGPGRLPSGARSPLGFSTHSRARVAVPAGEGRGLAREPGAGERARLEGKSGRRQAQGAPGEGPRAGGRAGAREGG